MATITKPKNKVRKYYQRTNDEKRAERQKVYQSTRWQRLRAFYLSEHPLCEECQANGLVVEAVDVHHVVSFVGKEEKTAAFAFDYSNLRALCKRCHQLTHNGKPKTHIIENK